MIVFPNAKINLGLFITEKRPDGFHNIESCFYPVPWNDVLEVSEGIHTSFSSSGIPVPGDEKDNLCLKAWENVHQEYGIPPVHIHLHKVIPIGAGMGGGSSDAAFTVKALNELFGLGLTEEKMEDLVRPLGSDCAFFIKNKPVLAVEKGDRFQDIPVFLSGFWGILVYPDLHISTKEAYSGIVPGTPAVSIREILTQKDRMEWKNLLINDFERHLFEKYPVLSDVKKELYNSGAVYASMTGSGSCVYGIFEKEPSTLKFENLSFSVKKFLFN
jgi:4-diphosphocytidyl-2-C-methyl-D-erythritol kinase